MNETIQKVRELAHCAHVAAQLVLWSAKKEGRYEKPVGRQEPLNPREKEEVQYHRDTESRHYLYLHTLRG